MAAPAALSMGFWSHYCEILSFQESVAGEEAEGWGKLALFARSVLVRLEGISTCKGRSLALVYRLPMLPCIEDRGRLRREHATLPSRRTSLRRQKHALVALVARSGNSLTGSSTLKLYGEAVWSRTRAHGKVGKPVDVECIPAWLRCTVVGKHVDPHG